MKGIPLHYTLKFGIRIGRKMTSWEGTVQSVPLRWLSRPDIEIGNRRMHGDIILVGNFAQMVVTSYRLHSIWTTDPKSTV